MYLKKLLKLHTTLAFRLTFWYTIIFVISFSLAFFGIYFLTVSTIHERVDQELLSDKTEFASLLVYGSDTVKDEIEIETESEGANKIFFRILTLTGEELAVSNLTSWGNVEIDKTALTRLRSGTNYVFRTIEIPKHHQHKARILYSIIGPDKILQVGRSLKDDEYLLESFRKLFGTTMIILSVFSALTGWFMARRALKGIGKITSTAIEISDGALEKRVPVNLRCDEIDRLAVTFNSMLDRINILINEMKEMTDNIAHDLKSPLTRIRGLAEIVLTTGKSMDEFKEMAASTIEECDYLMEMINTLLMISEIDAKLNNFNMADIDMVDLIQNACEIFQPISDIKGITIATEMPDICLVRGDLQKLQRMMANLLDNAIKYTRTGGSITISLKNDHDKVMISVKDTGIGISKDDLPLIFKRFYRCDQSRTKEGIGLGLSLASSICKAHNGNLTATSSPGKGSAFVVTLPG